jgi:hypothetical protein
MGIARLQGWFWFWLWSLGKRQGMGAGRGNAGENRSPQEKQNNMK